MYVFFLLFEKKKKSFPILLNIDRETVINVCKHIDRFAKIESKYLDFRNESVEVIPFKWNLTLFVQCQCFIQNGIGCR